MNEITKSISNLFSKKNFVNEDYWIPVTDKERNNPNIITVQVIGEKKKNTLLRKLAKALQNII